MQSTPSKQAYSRTRCKGERGTDRLAKLLERLAMAPQTEAPRPQFKAPQYNETSDVEYFIHRFREVAEANRWMNEASLLHLREALREDAENCGEAGEVGAIFKMLQARFGLSPRQAKTQLNSLRKTALLTACRVERLVKVAYRDLLVPYQADMAKELFCNSLNDTNLQRNLLAVPTVTLKDAVQAGTEFLQIRLKRWN